MLTALEEKARQLGYRVMRLETGNRQRAAMVLYESYGFYRIAPFGEYATDTPSVCYEKFITDIDETLRSHRPDPPRE